MVWDTESICHWNQVGTIGDGKAPLVPIEFLKSMVCMKERMAREMSER
jgi:hypothetical protein